MLRKALPALFLAISAVAFAAPPPSGHDTMKKQPKAGGEMKGGEMKAGGGEGLTVLHAVAKWSNELSQMADTRAKSQSVKDYAREMAAKNGEKDAKLMEIAKKAGIEMTPLDPKTEEGKSVLDRMKAETTLLRSLEGDAFDKEYMTLVTNTQQSLIKFLEKHESSATNDDVKQLMGDMKTAVQERLKRAQDIMAEVYGDTV
jgi:predicted outer membrane protein